MDNIKSMIITNIILIAWKQMYRRASNDGTFDSTALRHAGSASCEMTIFCSWDDIASYRI